MSVVLFVRIKSNLEPAELERRINKRRARFLKVPGLVQKVFGRDPANGDICGIYFFENEKSLSDYRDSKLAKSIPDAYEAIEVRREVFDVLSLSHLEEWPDRKTSRRGSAPSST